MSAASTRPRRTRAKKLVIHPEPIVDVVQEEPVAAPEEPVAQPAAAPEEPVAQPAAAPEEPAAAPTTNVKLQRRPNKRSSIYSQSLLSRELLIPFRNVGNNLRPTLEKMIQARFEGKCGAEGFIRPGSTKVFTHSTGTAKAANVAFTVAFECQICNPVEGMHIRCVVKNITKAGIRAEVDDGVSPVVVFVARDHHYMSETFAEVKENDMIVIRVIGQRFELNDKYISVIGQLVDRGTKRLAMKRT